MTKQRPMQWMKEEYVRAKEEQERARLASVSETTNSAYAVFEENMNPSRFTDMTIYAQGGHSHIYRATDTQTGQIVAVKEHFHYIPDEIGADPKAIREAEKRFRSESRALARIGSGHPGIVRAYGNYITYDKGKTVPHLVMELLGKNTIASRLERGEGFDEEEIRRTVLSVGSILNFIHTGNGKPLIYRDLKAGNVIVMPGDSEYPHKIVDFSESRIGNATFNSGSVMGSFGYSAPEQFGSGEADPSTDRYSLAKIATAMALQDERKFRELWFNAVTLRALHEEGSLPISGELLTVLEKATERRREDRYNSFSEMAGALGYDIKQTPKTRDELETILRNGGRQSLQIAPRQNPSETRIEKYEGRNAYEVIKDIWNNFELSKDEKAKIIAEHAGSSNHIGILRWKERDAKYTAIREAAEHYGITRPIARTIKDIMSIRDKTKRHGEIDKLSEASGIDCFWASGLLNSVCLAAGEDTSRYIIAPILFTVAYPLTFNKIRNSKKQVQELDTYLAQAGVFQDEEQTALVKAGGLEGKVAELSEDEKDNIFENSIFTGLGTGAGIFMGVGTLVNFNTVYLPHGALAGLIGGGLISLSVNKYLKRKLLNEKRRALGQPEEKGLVGKLFESRGKSEKFGTPATFKIHRAMTGKVEKALKKAGLKKKLFKRKFVGEGIEIEYDRRGLMGASMTTDGAWSDYHLKINSLDVERIRNVGENLINSLSRDDLIKYSLEDVPRDSAEKLSSPESKEKFLSNLINRKQLLTEGGTRKTLETGINATEIMERNNLKKQNDNSNDGINS